MWRWLYSPPLKVPVQVISVMSALDDATIAPKSASVPTACESTTAKDRVTDRRGQTEGPAFEFSSGQPDREDGHGQWNVRLRGNALWLAYSKPGRTRASFG